MALCDELNSSPTDLSSQVRVVNRKECADDIALPSDEVDKRDRLDRENHDQGDTLLTVPENASEETDNRTLYSQSHQERSMSSISPEKEPHGTGLLALPSSQDGSAPTISPGKALESPGSDFHASPLCLEGSSSSTREKAPDDGYNWRKYGQKNVRGNEYIRSYYKCTHPNCQVKRQVEHSHDGQITDTIFFGQHQHPKPQLYLSLPADFVMALTEDRHSPTRVDGKSPIPLDQTPCQIQSIDSPRHSKVGASDDGKGAISALTFKSHEVHNHSYPDSKRQKKHNSDADVPSVDKAIGEPRLIVQTVSEIDFVNDGFRWRKYGQKLVKGNSNPRSYYRCSSPGCPVKKHVERASRDSKVVVTTYEGKHDHDIPPTRTVTNNSSCPNSNTTGQTAEPCTKHGDSDNLCSHMVTHTTSGPGSMEQLNNEARLKTDMVVQRKPGHESETNEQHISNLVTHTEESDALDMAGHSSSGTKSRRLEKVNGAASMLNEQQARNAETVES